MSNLWWTYAAATVGLTCAVLMLWAAYTRQENKNETSKKSGDLEKVQSWLKPVLTVSVSYPRSASSSSPRYRHNDFW